MRWISPTSPPALKRAGCSIHWGISWNRNGSPTFWLKVKGGKEASVYLCRSGGQVDVPFLAAKVFRPRMLRNLKNDRMYLVGRDVLDEDGNQILDLGMLKAHHKRSVYGEQIRHQSWIMHEFQTLLKLHDAGADVPRPYETSHNAILMDYIGSEGNRCTHA